MSINEIVDAVAREVTENSAYALNDSQLTVLRFCLQDQERSRPLSYRAMADESGYTFNTLRSAGSELFGVLSPLLQRTVRRNTCNRLVREWYHLRYERINNPLFGRQDDLDQLLTAILSQNKRLICVYGPPSVGKKALVDVLWDQICDHPTPHFAVRIQCDAKRLSTVAALYQYVCEELEEESSTALPASLAMTRLFRRRPFFIQLYNVDELFDPQYPDGRFQEGSRCYEDWLQDIRNYYGLPSCLIVIARIPPRCLDDDRLNLCRYRLRPLQKQHALELLRSRNIPHDSTQTLEEIVHFCGYIPGVLKVIAIKIANYRRPVRDYYSLVASAPHSIDDTWEFYLSRLSQDEQIILAWLLLYPFVKIRWENDELFVGEQQLPINSSALVCLDARGLIDFDERHYPLLASRWVRYFVARHVAANLVNAYMSDDPEALNQYPLMVAHAPLWHRQWQEQWVIGVLDGLLRKIGDDRGLWSKSHRTDRVYGLLQKICSDADLRQGYVTGNLMNIAVALNLSLSNLAFSRMTIRNADLSAVSLQGLRVQDCEFVNHVLPVHLHGQLVVAMSPNGQTIAVGDAEGRICCWQRQNDNGFYQLFRFSRIRNAEGTALAISKLSFGNEFMLGIVAADCHVHRWWLRVEQEPEPLMTLPKDASSLICCEEDFIAIGLEGGDIYVQYDIDPPFSLSGSERESQFGHTGDVKFLAANIESGQLLSIGYGDRFLVWDIWEPDSIPREYSNQRIYSQLAARNDGWVAAVVLDDDLYLSFEGGRQLQYPHRKLGKLSFSRSGDFLAVRRIIEAQENRCQVEIHNVELTNCRTIAYSEDLQDIQISNDGCWLMTFASDVPHHVRLWDMREQRVCWELSPEPERMRNISSIQLSSCSGLSNAERGFWADYGATL